MPEGANRSRASVSKIHIHRSAVVYVIYTLPSASRFLFKRQVSSRTAALKSSCQVMLNSQVL